MSTTQTLIVPADISDEDLDTLAASLGVFAICKGIPPRLAELIAEADLPTVYTETVEDFTDASGAACETREAAVDDTEIAPVFEEIVSEGGSGEGGAPPEP